LSSALQRWHAMANTKRRRAAADTDLDTTFRLL